ncbi:transporter substrate-binding domain-containing protein [Pseudoduganella sp. FT55W]|uniref:Transporter substrate-binding domain-containing protein n=1 Tax=Duganella rivi TaxID=2666083 RepID=A0A7X4GNM8_9BURK|nr:transporter substrate-binding domain-containing protein [Duganella rivi]MYM66837.1 transporter substrate-binding domain-containing protein [Duganella rivi]
MRCQRSNALLIASLLLAPLACAAQDTIHVAYAERPPYLLQQADGSPAGLTGTPTTAAFKAAGIPVQWHIVPTNRQLAMIKDPKGLNCTIGWFSVPERQAYAKYTKAIYRDKSWLLLTNAAFAERGITTMAELASQRDIRVLVKDNFSYGGLDKFIHKWHPVVAVSTASTVKMVQSVAKGAVDMMFVSEDEGNYILKNEAGEYAASLRLLQLKDMPRGGDRHIMCSRAVPDEVIARLNKAITFK